MLNLILLLRVRLHLIDLILLLRPHIRRVIARIIDQLLLQRQIHDIGAHTVHEILRM